MSVAIICEDYKIKHFYVKPLWNHCNSYSVPVRIHNLLDNISRFQK